MKKRIVSILLAVCLSVSLCSALAITANAYPTSHPNTHVNTGDQRADVVAIAETQLGYAEDPGTKYGAWWQEVTASSHNFVNEAWCVMFAMWCTDQAGCTSAWKNMSALSSSLLTKYQNGQNGCSAYQFGSGYMPRPGDFIFVGSTSSDGSYYTNHVGLVVSVDETTIHTIEGNYNNKVSRSSYNIETGLRKGSSSRSIVWFGVPAYTNDSTPGFDGPVVNPDPGDSTTPDTGINYKTTLTNDLNVRADASINANVITALPKGTEVTIVDEKADDTGRMWGKLSTGGWISLRYTSTGNTTNPTVPGETAITPYEAVVACDILLIRVVPGTSAATDGQLYLGNSVTIVATATANEIEWGKLSTGGWVATKYLNKVGGETPAPEQPEQTPPTETPETVLCKGTITASTLNVRKAPVDGEIVGILRNGESVDIYETKDVGNGKLWGRTKDGWISMSYVKVEQATVPETPAPEQPETETPAPETPAQSVTCQVTGSSVNVRQGAGTSHPVTKTVKKGQTIVITETTTVGTTPWGKLSDGGWICLTYTTYSTAFQQPTTPETPAPETPAPEQPETETPSGSETPGTSSNGVVCTVTGTLVNLRSGAGTSHSVITTVSKGTVITIVETANVNGSLWGKLSTGGWISLNYTNYSSVAGSQQPSVPETPAPEQPAPETSTPEVPEQSAPVTGGISATVTAANLNVRKTAGYSEVVGTVKGGTAVTILETRIVDGSLWGRISTGWISMSHVSTNAAGSAGLTYTVTTGVNVRSGAGTSNAVVSSVGSGSKVTLVSFATASDGKIWGQLTSGGWICMDYVAN